MLRRGSGLRARPFGKETSGRDAYDSAKEISQHDWTNVDTEQDTGELTARLPAPPADAPRARHELAILVAEWALAWAPDGLVTDEIPAEYFREDEFEVVASLEAGELLVAAQCITAALADHVETRDGRSDQSRRIRLFSERLGWEARQRICSWKPHTASRGRPVARRSPRRAGSARRRSRAPARLGADPEPPPLRTLLADRGRV